jgi:restriction endonuclease S subunit
MSVDDYFTIQYGQKEYESKSRLKKGEIPLISSASIDNGFYGFYDIEPKFINVISFPRTGSIGEARVHDYPCCIDNNCMVLVPKKKLTLTQLYYVASVLRSHKWRFKYGRQATETRLKNLGLPLMEKVNELWSVPKLEINNISNNFPKIMAELNGQRLGQLFDVVKGEGAYFQKCKVGRTPLISASEMDNGIIGFVDLSPTFKAPCITIERIRAKAHVQTVDFATVPDDIFVLKPKNNFTVEELFFVATLLNLNRWRFNYHRKVTKPRLEKIQFYIDGENKLTQVVIAPNSQNKLLDFD